MNSEIPKMIYFNENEKDKKPLFSNDTIDEFIELSKKHNTFKFNSINAILTKNTEEFNSLFDLYEKELIIKNPNNEHLNHIIYNDYAKILIEFINHKEFNNTNSLKYLKIIEKKLPAIIFVFLLWTQEKYDSCFKILKEKKFNLSEKMYDILLDNFQPYKDNSNLPINIVEKNNHIQYQKNEFLILQKRYGLLLKLEKLPEKNDKNKKIKI